MTTGFPIVHRMTQAEFDAGAAVGLSGGFIEIVDADGVPTGPMYITGISGSSPVSIGGSLISYRLATVYTEHFRVVYDIDGEYADLADPTDPAKCRTVLGVTEIATSAGGNMQVTTHGEIARTSGLLAGDMYLGAGGTITQVVPTTGVFVHLGYVANASLMFIDVQQPIILS